MPFRLGRKLGPLGRFGDSAGNLRYVFRDLFTTDRAAGAVNGTAAEPGPGNRTAANDNTNLMNISGGKLTFSGGRNLYTDPRLKEPGIARANNRVMEFDLTLPDATHYIRVGLWNGVDNPDSDAVLLFENTGKIYFMADATRNYPVGAYQGGVTYKARIVLMDLGASCYIKGGTYTDWTKLWIWPVGSTATLYPTVANYNCVGSPIDEIAVYDRVMSDYLLGAKVNGWTKTGSAVLARRAEKWDANTTREISIVMDESGNKVVEAGKIYSFYWGCALQDASDSGIGYATSIDNGVTWGERLEAPLIAASGIVGSWYRNYIRQAAVIQRASDGVWMMMAMGSGGLGVLTSTDKFQTHTDQGVKFTDADIAVSGYTGASAPAVIKRSSGDYLCLFEAHHAVNGWGIFGATSPDFVGDWTVMNGGQPLMAKSGSGWKGAGVSNPHHQEITPGNFLVAYTGFDANANRRVGFAQTNDFINWWDYPDNWVVQRDPSGWDTSAVESSFLDKDAYPSLVLYYHGFENNFTTIELGRATTTAP